MTSAAPLPAVIFTTGGAGEGERLPMIVALHGLGDRPENFAGLFHALQARSRVVVLRGVDSWGEGWSWFPIGSADDRPEGFRRGVDAIVTSMAEYQRRYPTCGLPVVTGFSQGAMMSYALVARERAVVSAAVPIAGRLPTDFSPRPRAVGGLLPPIVALHGTTDSRIAYDADRLTVERFRSVGYTVDFKTYEGVGHTITPVMHRDLSDALIANLPRCP